MTMTHGELTQRLTELIKLTSGGVFAAGAPTQQATDNTKAGSPAKPLILSQEASGFELGGKSVQTLKGGNGLPPVHPDLVHLVGLTIHMTKQDFTVYEGGRSLARQKQMVRQGTSHTMSSKHLVQPDGYAHAVDLVPWINGLPKWEWDGCYEIACAVDAAATQLGMANRVRWGGAWDRVLSDFGGSSEAYAGAVEAYRKRHDGDDFIDGPHFELVN